jgi:hypothetical protein
MGRESSAVVALAGDVPSDLLVSLLDVARGCYAGALAETPQPAS